MSFVCPRCEASSEHPDDAAHGYCGRCRDFTVRRTTFRYPAGDGTVYAPGAFDGLLGNDLTVSLDLGGGRVERRGRVLAADVVDDGRAVLVTIEAPADYFRTGRYPSPGSFGVRQ